jgi:hypothetical protein
MTSEDFWPSAWKLVDELRTTSATDASANTLVELLRDDLVLQQYVFVNQSWADEEWFATFRANGLFSNPPPVERIDGGLRTRGWPVMQYVKAMTQTDPTAVGEVLVGLRSDNWWVISEAIETAAALPDQHALPALLNLLAEWQSAPATWTHAETIAHALVRLAEGSLDNSQIAVAVARVLDKLWRDNSQWYELEEVLGTLATAEARVRYRVADGIEMTLLGRRPVRLYRSSAFTPRLESLDAGGSDPIELLANRWLSLTDDERKIIGPDASYARSTRLIAVDDPLIRQMGLRSLRYALDERSGDRLAQQQLLNVASNADVLTAEGELSELLPLFRAHFGVLSPEDQVVFIDRVVGLAESQERLDHYYGRDWLAALERFLGPRERLMLSNLTAEVGAPRSEFETTRAVAEFIPMRGALSDAEVSELSALELLTLMRNVPRLGDAMFDTSINAVAAQAKAEIERRLDDFLPLLPSIASDVRYPAILHHVVWGLSETLKQSDYQSPETLDAVLSFLRTLSERATNGDVDDGAESGYGPRSVLSAVADLLEDLAPWVMTTPHTEILLATLRSVLASEDPTPEHEAQYGGSNMDPPTLALNTARGRATRALLRLLVETAASESAGQAHLSALTDLTRSRATEEASSSVKSAYGIYLPWLVTRLPDLWSEIGSTVMPADANDQTWDAVFTTYILFNHPHRGVADSVRRHYEVAIGRFTDAFPFFLAHADRLLTHLIALARPNGAGADDWFELLVDALGSAPDDAVEGAIRSFAHAVRREADLVRKEWAISLARRRLERIGDREHRRPMEATGLLDLILATGVTPVEAGGEILALMQAGASPRDWSVIEYLIDRDRPRTAIGIQILARAVADDDFRGFLRDPEAFEQLLTDYAGAAPHPTWRLVNQLGRNGVFIVESVALTLVNRGR